MLNEFNTKIENIEVATKDIKKYRFSVPENFTFTPGQFVMIEFDVNGQKEQRAFSIYSSPTRKGFVEISKKLTASEYSKKLDSAQTGFPVTLKGPFGSFILDEKNDCVMIAGGIGVAPFHCFLDYANEKKLRTNLTLFYSNKTPEDIAFKQEFDRLSNNSSRKVIYTVTRPQESQMQWTGLTGRFDENTIKKFIEVKNQTFYICGPPAMVDGMNETLLKLGVPKEKIKMERFFGYS